MSQSRQQPKEGASPPPARTKKSLVIGINYEGSQNELKGCHKDAANMVHFIIEKGWESDQDHMILMVDDDTYCPRDSNYWPRGHNIVCAMHWLLREPNTTAFFHYSGHGGQTRDPDHRHHSSGVCDTIVPADWEVVGQIGTHLLHQMLVTKLKPNSTLFAIFDCCHSGSVLELPFIYRSDEDGKVSLIDNVEASTLLVEEASHLIQGGFNITSLQTAKQLLAGASSFLHSVMNQEAQETDQYGLGKQDFASEYRGEDNREVWMFSGCRDDQTSSDASVQGQYVGAISWAFLKCMQDYGSEQTLLQVLQRTRQILAGRFRQVPQLSVGREQDLNYPIPL